MTPDPDLERLEERVREAFPACQHPPIIIPKREPIPGGRSKRMSESNVYIPPIIPGVNTLLEGEYRSAAPFEVPDWKPFISAYADGEMHAKSVTVHPPET